MKNYLRPVNIVIGLLTIVSGLVQIFAPSVVLKLVGAEITPTTAHFFGIVGMFMLLFGGLIIHALYSTDTNKVAILWCALQKFGASIAVGLGIAHHLFSLTAGLVALFDLVSGILIFVYYRSIRNN